MTKIVINACYGGFGLSDAAVRLARKLSGNPKWMDITLKGEIGPDGRRSPFTTGFNFDAARTDPILVEVVETLAGGASDEFSHLVTVEIEPGTRYRIRDYDGNEFVETKNSIDWKVA